MADPRFSGTVIFMVQHDDTGASEDTRGCSEAIDLYGTIIVVAAWIEVILIRGKQDCAISLGRLQRIFSISVRRVVTVAIILTTLVANQSTYWIVSTVDEVH